MDDLGPDTPPEELWKEIEILRRRMLHIEATFVTLAKKLLGEDNVKVTPRKPKDFKDLIETGLTKCPDCKGTGLGGVQDFELGPEVTPCQTCGGEGEIVA